MSRSLISDSKRREAATSRGKLTKLQAERTRWQRKATIAANKLDRVNRQIETLAAEMAAKLHTSEWTGENTQ